MSEHAHDIETLNSLLETLIDSVDGFEQASQAADSAAAKSVFANVASDRRGLVSDFERAVRDREGEPVDHGSILAKAHRATMKLRDALSSGDAAIASEAERGEEYLLDKFQKAAGEADLAADTRQFIANGEVLVRRGRDHIVRLQGDLAAVED